MTKTSFPLPESVDLKASRGLADDLLRHIARSAAPTVTTAALRQGGVPLLQILVAARLHATAQGKPFTVKADPDSAFARLLADCGLDPTLCGAPADLVPSPTATSVQRT